jgi:hypothetical protein
MAMSGTGEIREHMEVVGADGGHVGTVDGLVPGAIKLTRQDDPAGLGGHRMVPLSAIAEVEAGRVRLRVPAQQARAMAAGGQDPDRMEEGFQDTGDDAATNPSGVNDSGHAAANGPGSGNIQGTGRMVRQGGTAGGESSAGGTGGGGTAPGHLGSGPGFRGDPNMDPSGRGEV